MVIVYTGSDGFAVQEEVNDLAARANLETEKIEGVGLTIPDLADLLLGTNLFREQRLVVVRDLSANSSVWQALPDWLERMDETTTLVLIEPKLDKRSRTYKYLTQHTEIREREAWTVRDLAKAKKWTGQKATDLGLELKPTEIEQLVQRSIMETDRGASIDKNRLVNNLEKLALAYGRGLAFDDIIEPSSSASAFDLLASALSGHDGFVIDLNNLRAHEDPFRVSSLMATQVFYLAALANSSKPTDKVAHDLGAHPYAIRQMSGLARRLSRQSIKRAATILADADYALKSSPTDPWLVLEGALVKIAAGRN